VDQEKAKGDDQCQSVDIRAASLPRPGTNLAAAGGALIGVREDLAPSLPTPRAGEGRGGPTNASSLKQAERGNP